MTNKHKNSQPLPPEDIANEQLRFAAERITQHEDKSYENFSLFLKLSTAIIGGLGYLAVFHKRDQEWWVVQKIAWNLWWLEVFVASFFSLVIVLEYLGIRRQWDKQSEMGVKKGRVSWWEVYKHVQLYFVVGMMTLCFGLRKFLVQPLFK